MAWAAVGVGVGSAGLGALGADQAGKASKNAGKRQKKAQEKAAELAEEEVKKQELLAKQSYENYETTTDSQLTELREQNKRIEDLGAEIRSLTEGKSEITTEQLIRSQNQIDFAESGRQTVRDQREFIMQSYDEWENTFGNIQENLSTFYNNLTPDTLAASNLEVQAKSHQQQVIALQRKSGQQGFTTPASELLRQDLNVKDAERRAEIRNKAKYELLEKQESFVNEGVVNKLTDEQINTYINEREAIRDQINTEGLYANALERRKEDINSNIAAINNQQNIVANNANSVANLQGNIAANQYNRAAQAAQAATNTTNTIISGYTGAAVAASNQAIAANQAQQQAYSDIASGIGTAGYIYGQNQKPKPTTITTPIPVTTNTPTDTPTNTPTDTPTDTPTNTPTDTPTEIFDSSQEYNKHV